MKGATVSEQSSTGGSRFGVICACGQRGVGDAVEVMRPPEVVQAARCPDHGPILSEPLSADGLVDLLMAAPGLSPQWIDMATVTTSAALLGAGLPVPMLIVDPDAQATFSNQAWSTLTGLSGLASLGQRWLSALRVEWAGTLMSAVRSDLPVTVSLAVRPSPSITLLLTPRPLVGLQGEMLGHLITLTGATGTDGPAPPAQMFSHGRGGDARELMIEGVARALERRHGPDSTVAVTVVQVEKVEKVEKVEGEPTDEQTLPITDRDLLTTVGNRIDAISRRRRRLVRARGRMLRAAVRGDVVLCPHPRAGPPPG